jgi:hypothetical protein
MGSQLTYGELTNVLRSFGFSVWITEDETALVHKHESGAQLTFPRFPESMVAQPVHIVASRAQLDAFGIAEPAEFDDRLRQADSRRPA